jgi:hypothetical protein
MNSLRLMELRRGHTSTQWTGRSQRAVDGADVPQNSLIPNEPARTVSASRLGLSMSCRRASHCCSSCSNCALVTASVFAVALAAHWRAVISEEPGERRGLLSIPNGTCLSGGH